jgi:tetrahydromethanopterin S-methyltransferase subunit D
VAQTLIDYQQNPAVGVYDGHWFGNDYYYTQEQFETAWSIIMLRKTVFVTCITNLYGAGTAGKGSKAARVDLTWSGQTNATSYNVLRSSTNGGPYVQIGVSTITGYTDLTGVNGATYYYVVQPVNGASEICQSNQEAVTIP